MEKVEEVVNEELEKEINKEEVKEEKMGNKNNESSRKKKIGNVNNGSLAIENQEVIWNIIDHYFKDNPNVLIKHHLDSFNQFFNRDIKNIFREKNPITILKEFDEEVNDYTLQAKMYFAGRDGSKIHYGKPVIFDEDRQHFMFPNEARLRNMSYGITIHIDIDVEYKMISADKTVTTSSTTLENVYLGRFPIMLNSDLCILNTLNRMTKFNMGECRNDLGGYFIVDGKEKVIVSQEKFADNMLYVRDKYNELYSHSADIRSVSEDASKPIRTFSIRIVSPSATSTNNQIVVNVPNVRKPVPLFILMRALGIESDKAIIEHCLLDLEKNSDYINLFIPCVHNAGRVFNQITALKYIATFTKGKTIPHVLYILMDYLLPHIGELNFRNKAFFIGHMVFELLKVYRGVKPATDRDSFNFKRVELPGSLIYDLFKEYYTLQQKHVFQKIDKEYYYKQGIYKTNFTNLIENNVNDIFREKILETGFKKAFKGNWGAEAHTKRPGAVQGLNRLSFNSFLSHLRKINLPLDSSAKVVGPRLLHSSQWGIIDPVDTPDGGNVGLHKHMAISATITSGCSAKPLIELLRNQGKIELLTEASVGYIANATKIFVNGAWIGITTNSVEVLKLMKIYRRNGLIPVFTSISWDINQNLINFYTDAGRLCRPVFYVSEMMASYRNPDIYKRLTDNDYQWTNLIVGFNPLKDEKLVRNLNDCNVYEKIDDLYDVKDIETLMQNQGIIEYIDTAETESSLIAISHNQIQKFTTNLEIHPSLILGIMGNQVVFPENNQLPRNLFCCGQSKQAVSIYHSNYHNRIDKMGVILNYGEIPLVKSRYLKYINNEEHPYGFNAIVAIGCYGGYNVEDSILFNEASVKRGMFRTTYFSMYETYEESSKVGNSVMDSKFANVESEPVIGLKPGYDYSSLDKHGLIKENTLMDDKKVVIGKITNNLDNPGTFLDNSIGTKKGQMGYVDKSFITEGDEGFRIAKVRIREERIPAVGDKFCSRCGQKGTIGQIIPEADMPFTEHGIRPDLIINPHALPSRMTIGQLVETLMGKACAEYGGFGDCTAFVNEGSRHEIFGKLLTEIGYKSDGNELLYNGETGEQLESELFIGPCHYMRLKHMVKDKINYRAQGPRTVLTRQTVQGRANDGGLRIGEMERDGVIGHGASMFLKQSMMERGDDYYIAICNKTGTLAVYNSNNNVYMSLFSDGPLKFSGNTVDNLNLENVTQFGRSFSIVRVPYAFKLLMQELQVMNIQMRIITEDNVSQFDSMAYGKTVNIDFNKLQETKKLTRKKSKPKEEEPDEGVGDGVDDGVDEQESTTEEPDEQESPTEEPGGVVGDESPTEEEDNETEEEMLKYLNPVTVESIMKARQEAELYKDDNSDDGSEDEDKKPALTMGETLPENALNIDSLKNLGNNDKIKIGNVIDPANLANKGNGGIDEIVLSSEIIDNKNTEKSKNVLMEVADEDLTVENNESGEDSNDSNDSKDTKGIKLIV
jgi:DNA-directed RNA polymerase II subunit RPB2